MYAHLMYIHNCLLLRNTAEKFQIYLHNYLKVSSVNNIRIQQTSEFAATKGYYFNSNYLLRATI